MDSSKRIAYHAGSWYDDDSTELSKELSKYFSKATKLDQASSLKSIIVPHAGYYFCGPTAAKAFINIDPSKFDRAVILGPSHHEYFEGCGLSPFSTWETPYGDIKVDTQTMDKLLKEKNSFFTLPQTTCVREHSIEMELPFLKYIFGKKDFKIVPLMIGQCDLEENVKIGKNLYDLYEDPKTLFVVSSDFCHWGRNFGFTYYNKEYGNIWESTKALDMKALDIIGEMDSKKLDAYFKSTRNTICGRNPITITLSIIEKYKQNHQDKKISFDTAGYTQSNQVKSMSETSVSYAAGVNFVN